MPQQITKHSYHMSNSPTILVTGATGTIGREVVAALLSDERLPTIRIASRDPGKASTGIGGSRAELAQGIENRVEYTRFDFADASTYGEATRGADAVFVLGPPLDPQLDELLRPFIEHLAGILDLRVVFFSAYGAERIGFMTRVLDDVRERLPAATVLQPGFFATNFGNYDRDNIEQRDMIFQTTGEGRTAFIDPADIGRCAAATLLDDGHAGRTYVLTGPELHANADIAAVLTEIRGRDTRYVAASEEAYRGALAGACVPGFVADYMLSVYALIAEGHVGEVTEDVERLTGCRPTNVRAVLERDFGRRGN